jgi:predicted phosphodiesterase
MKTYKKICILPDIHCPAADMPKLRDLSRFAKKWQPDIVVQLGDLTDQRMWSRFSHEPDADNASTEWEKTVEQVAEVHSLFPSMTILLGNHCERYMKRAFEVSIPKQLIKSLEELFPYEGWMWHTGNQPLVLNTPTGNVSFMHGDNCNANLSQLAQRVGMSTVRGHTHQAGLLYTQTFQGSMFAMECGCIVDESHPAMGYAAKSPKRCFIGFATIENGVPELFRL